MPNSAQPTTRELPSWLLVLIPAGGWILMAAIDMTLWLDENPPSPGLHSLFLCAVVTLTILSHRVHDRQQRNRRSAAVADRICQVVIRESVAVQRLICRTYAERETPTEPILRVVGTATVTPKPDDELPGYAKGYVDGLSREPMKGKVIPIEGHRA